MRLGLLFVALGVTSGIATGVAWRSGAASLTLLMGSSLSTMLLMVGVALLWRPSSGGGRSDSGITIVSYQLHGDVSVDKASGGRNLRFVGLGHDDVIARVVPRGDGNDDVDEFRSEVYDGEGMSLERFRAALGRAELRSDDSVVVRRVEMRGSWRTAGSTTFFRACWDVSDERCSDGGCYRIDEGRPLRLGKASFGEGDQCVPSTSSDG